MALQTVQCIVQNKLGALDRVLAAFTLRGFIPQEFVVTAHPADPNMHIKVTFACSDQRVLDKLIKVLRKQIHVIEVMTQGQTSAQPASCADPAISNFKSSTFARPTNVQEKERLHA